MTKKIKLSDKETLRKSIEGTLEHIRLLIADFQTFERELTSRLNNLDEEIIKFEEKENANKQD
jgi:hypothetical protein